MGVPSIWHIITNISDGLWHHILQRIACRYYNFNRAFNHKKVREQTTETRVSIKFHFFNPRSALAEWPQSSEPYFLSASLTKWSDETAILLKWWINEFHVKTFYGQNAAKIPGNCSQRNTTLNAISLTFGKNVHKTETDVHCTIISLSLRKTMSFNEHFFHYDENENVRNGNAWNENAWNENAFLSLFLSHWQCKITLSHFNKRTE